MIAGGGWHAAFANVDMPGEVFTEPIVVWADEQGVILGVVVDPADPRFLRPARSREEFVGYVLPDDVEAMEGLEETARETARRLRRERGLPPVDEGP